MDGFVIKGPSLACRDGGPDGGRGEVKRVVSDSERSGREWSDLGVWFR